MPHGLETVMFRARTTLKTHINYIRQVATNVNVRKQWETILYDMQGFDISSNMNYLKTYYAYRAPKFVGIGISDRDFVLS